MSRLWNYLRFRKRYFDTGSMVVYGRRHPLPKPRHPRKKRGERLAMLVMVPLLMLTRVFVGVMGIARQWPLKFDWAALMIIGLVVTNALLIWTGLRALRAISNERPLFWFEKSFALLMPITVLLSDPTPKQAAGAVVHLAEPLLGLLIFVPFLISAKSKRPTIVLSWDIIFSKVRILSRDLLATRVKRA